MRKIVFIFILLFQLNSFGQNNLNYYRVDSLKLVLKNLPSGDKDAKYDTLRIKLLILLANQYGLTAAPESILLGEQAQVLAKKINFKRGEAEAYTQLGFFHENAGNLNAAIEQYQKSFVIMQTIGNNIGIATALNNIGTIYLTLGKIPIALEHLEKCLSIMQKIDDKKGIAGTLGNIGSIYFNTGEIDKAMNYFSRSLKMNEILNDQSGIAVSLNNLALIYLGKGDVSKALEYFDKSLVIKEKLNDKKGISIALNNLAQIYDDQGEKAKAIEFYNKSLKISKESGNKIGEATVLNLIGLVYKNQGNFVKALEFYLESLKMRESIGDKKGIAFCLNNIGLIYKNQGDPMVTSSKEEALRIGLPKAIDYLNRSLKIREEINDKKGTAVMLHNIGGIYFKQKNYHKALELCQRSMKIGFELGFPLNISNAAKLLSEIYKATGNSKLALENYELHIQMRDSINNESTRKASTKQQLKYEYEKQAAADSVAHAKESEIKNVELEKQKVEIAAKKNQQYALFGGLLLVLTFAGFMYNRFKITQKQKFVIEEQKIIVEYQKKIVDEKQKEVLDSIHYAKRIQTALLPSDKYIYKNLHRLNKS